MSLRRRYPWITEGHKQELIRARQVLVKLLESDGTTIDPIQTNTDEYKEVVGIVGRIEKLLGY